MPSVGSTPVSLGTDSTLVQNLGPDNLYIGLAAVTTGTGVRVAVGESVSTGVSNVDFYAVSDGTSDVRTLSRGTGIYAAVTTTP